MSKCTNREVGNLLHGYEIGVLLEKECEQFELHLLECVHCHDLLKSFDRHASLLKTGARVKAFIDETLSQEAGTESLVGRIWQHLWPKVPFVFRPAVAYLLLVLLVIPAYQGLRKPGKPTISEFRQTIHLSPTRAPAMSLKKGASDYALLTFQFDRYRTGGIYQVVIESEDGVVIYSNNEFSSFDEREIGSLNLALSEMKPGKYRLIVFDPQSDSARVLQQYLFSIEE